MKNKITDCKHRINESPASSELIATILDSPVIPFPPDLSSEEDCLAHLFYDEILNPTVEFTVMPAKKT